MKLQFDSITESLPGPMWKSLFRTHWSAYRAWFESKGASERHSLAESEAAVKQYIPEWNQTYERLLELAAGDPVAARFLTGYCPPAYISGCSQAVLHKTRQSINQAMDVCHCVGETDGWIKVLKIFRKAVCSSITRSTSN